VKSPALKNPVDHHPLLPGKRLVTMQLPEPGLAQGIADLAMGSLKVMSQCVEEPALPGGDVQALALRAFQDRVIAAAVIQDCRGYGIEANGLRIGLCESEIAHGPGKTSIAIIKGVERHEPQVREPRTQEWIHVLFP